MAKEKNIYQSRLRNKYHNEVIGKLSSKLNIENLMRLPKIEKIVLNMGIGDARDNANALKSGVEELSAICGQKAVVTKSKKAISNFKTRQGDPVGIRVTLRRKRMYEFLDRFISVASPRIRDFQGLRIKGFDGRGNYNFGIDEQIIFPEVDYDKVNQIRGLNITIVTSTNDDVQAYELLKHFSFPLNEMKKTKALLSKKVVKTADPETEVAKESETEKTVEAAAPETEVAKELEAEKTAEVAAPDTEENRLDTKNFDNKSDLKEDDNSK